MLESFRNKRNSTILMLVFGAIIIVFIFWGVGPTGNGDSDQSVVATVDGESISVREYAGLYKRQLEYYKNTLKDQFNEEFARKFDLRHRALDILINRALALKEADSQGIKVTEAEIQDAIKAMPAFSKNGAFDKDTYFKALSANRVTPADFEKSMEKDILTGKVRDRVVKEVKVTDEEAKAVFSKEFRKLDFSYVALDGSRFSKGVSVTDDEAKEYLKKNASAFMVPVKIKAFYAFVPYSESGRLVTLTDAEVKEYYEKNKGQYDLPEAVKARHILIRPDQNAADKAKAKEEARKKAEDILARVKKGGNFAELARQFSQDPGSAKQGGELGWFQKGVMVKAFEEGTFALKKGEVSNLIETEFGFHIIKVEDRKEAGVMPLKSVEASIRRTLTGEKAFQAAKDTAASLEKAFTDAKAVDELKKAASAKKGVRAVLTDFFSETDKKVELASNEALKGAVFMLRASEVTRPIETPEGLYVVKAVEKEDSRVPEYNEIASKVKEKAALEKAGAEAAKKAEELLKRVKGGEDLSAVAKAEGLKVEQTGPFSKAQGFIPRIGLFIGDKEKFFEATPAAPYYPEVVAHNGRYYILKLGSVKEADEALFAGRKEDFKSRLLAKKQDEAVGEWIKKLREKAKIKVYEERL